MKLLKKNNSIIYIISTVVFITAPAFAADNDIKKMIAEASGITDEDASAALKKKELALFDVYALAVKNTERLLIEGENSAQAEYRRTQAFGAFLPKVYLRGNKYFPGNDSKYSSSSQRANISLYGRQPIMTGLNEWSGFKGSLSDIKIKKYKLHDNAVQLLLNVSSNFYNIIQIEKSLITNEEILNLYRLTINELNRRAAIGRSRQSEVQRTNSELYKLEAVIKALRNDLTHAKLILKTLSNIESDVELIEGGNLQNPVYKMNELKPLVDSRWDVKIAAEELELAKTNVTAAYGGHFPTVYIDATYLLYQEKMPVGSSVSKTRDYYFSLGVEIPLFNGGITFAKVKEAESIKRQAGLNLANTVRLAELNIIDAYQSWESSMNEVEAFKKALLSAEENYNTVKNEYRLNLVTILDVISSLKSYQSARDDYERTVLQHKFNRIRLGIATNELIGPNINLLKVR